MYRFLSKSDLFEYVDDGVQPLRGRGMKDFQDMFVRHRLRGVEGLDILEMGGGHSRVAPILARRNRVVNADKFEGKDGGPANALVDESVKVVRTWLGEGSPELADASFDIVFSISVLEHIKDRGVFERMVADIDRVLKPGGRTIHASDIYLYQDEDQDRRFCQMNHSLCRMYRKVFGSHFELTGEDEIADPPQFKTWMVTNPDHAMLAWNKVSPTLKPDRALAQVATIVGEWQKPG